MTSPRTRESRPVIKLLGPDHPDRLAALRLIVGGGALPPDQADRSVRMLLDSIERQSLNDDLLFSARVEGRLMSACVAVESPGGTALVLLGPTDNATTLAEFGVSLLVELQLRAWQRDVVLLQALLETDVTHAADTYRDAGFRYLAELVYQDCPLAESKRIRRGPRDLTYTPYSRELDRQFVGVLQASYVQSLDCPKLTGLRDARDVLLGHKHTGIHDPHLWFLALRGDKPVGVLLMSGVAGRSCLEIVYMGVAAEQRGRHIGDALLALAVDVGRQRGVEWLTLAVDNTNVYAWRLYERWGFTEVARRRVWIATRPR